MKNILLPISIIILAIVIFLSIHITSTQAQIYSGSVEGGTVACSSDGSVVYVVSGDKLHVSSDGGNRWNTHQIFSNTIR